MFCDQCGTPLEDSANFCTKCGKRLAPAAEASQATAIPVSARPAFYGRVSRHLQLVAILWFVYAAIRLVDVFWLYAVGRIYIPSFVGAIVSMSHPIVLHYPFGWLLSSSLAFIATWILFWSVVQLIAAWGLLERAPWARLLILVLAILSLLRFPLGTVLGIYTLWALLPERSAVEYRRLAENA